MGALFYDSMRKLAEKVAVGGGKRRSISSFEWDVAGDCEEPVTRECWSRPSADHPALARARAAKVKTSWQLRQLKRSMGTGPTMYSWERPPKAESGGRYIAVGKGHGPGLLSVQLTVRCRKCTKCRRRRSAMWYARAITETVAAHRTWFGTITLNPDAHHLALTRARNRARKSAVNFDQLTAEEQFSRTHREIGVQLQLWLKRVRKNSGAPIRFFLVAELHKSGLPHYHCLVHETDEMRRVSKRTLDAAWSLGFTKFRLVDDPKQAGYLCKYLAKSALARVRASKRYGQTPLEPSVSVNHQLRESVNHDTQCKPSSAPTERLSVAREVSSTGAI